HAIQQEYKLVPLGAWGKSASAAPAVPTAGAARHLPPGEQVERLDAGAFFAELAQLMEENPPAPNDQPLVNRLGRLGIVPGGRFDLTRLPATVVDAIEGGVAAARARLRGAALASLGKSANGWHIPSDLGRYGTNYELRAAVALAGLGANLPEDAVYPGTGVDAAGH